jgi:hypothetical protein
VRDLKISPTLSLPAQSVTWVLAFLAKRGAGKTYSAADLAEEMIKAGIPIVVIDGMGIWWGLRVSKDTKSNGLPIVVFGGEHQDLPLVPEKASQMARAIVESNISCVLDLSGFSKTQSKKIVASFLDELYKINRMERHVFIEEADLWAPQRSYGPDEAVCLGAMINFVRRGGNHNLGCTVITQRSAALSKDILTQADCLVILRTLAPQDKKAIQLWVEEMTDKDKTALGKWYDSLKELENGEAWIWHPEDPVIYKKIHFRERETFHATREFIRTPQAGSIKLMDVQDFVTKFKAVFEPKPKEIAKTVEITSQTAWGKQPIMPSPRVQVEEVPRGQQPGVPVPRIALEQGQSTNPRLGKDLGEPVVPTGKPPQQDGGMTVQQALPTLTIQQFKPNLVIPVEMLDQPTTPLGRVAVVLKNDSNDPGKWSLRRIVRDIKDHGWDAADTQQVIDKLLQWEILHREKNGLLRFHKERVQIVESNPSLGAW